MSAMVEEVELVAEDGQEGGGRGKLVVLLSLVALLLVGGGAVWFLVLGGDREPPPPEDGEIIPLEPLTTTTGEETLRHARVGIAIVLTNGEDPAVVEPSIPLLQDALLREVAGMSADQLRSVEGSEELRFRLSAHARDIWGEEVVRRVVLTELLLH